MEYDFRKIEQHWQKRWKEENAYRVENDFSKPKYYVLDMFPYPSGAGLHVGHPLGYIASDIFSRYKKLKGFNVLHPMGFDSFGLPAEQYALETGQHPAVTTHKNIATFKAQLDRIGFCYDWSREVRTSDPRYYRWTQWIFLQLFNSYFCHRKKKALPISQLIHKYETKGAMPETGDLIPGKHFTADQWKACTKKEQEDILMRRRLAYSAYGEVNWCEALGTVLANDEVVNGVSERGGYPVEKRKMRQWYLRITEYADRLLEGLETVEFSESMKEMQRNWIGKSEGAEIEFAVVGRELKVKVYTTRPDTIFGVDFIVIAPEHDLVQKITAAAQKDAVEKYLNYVKSRSDRERLAEVKQITGCFTGAYVLNPFNGRQIPVWTSEYVLAGYGTGAIMAVPCGDERDHNFAKHFNIPITNIIGDQYNGQEANATRDAILENCDFMNGMPMRDAVDVVMNKIEEMGIGKRKVNYRMRDAGFSRQRYWGEPFPIVWEDGIAVPLDENDLPLELPHVDKYGPGTEGQGPLANIREWVDLTHGPSAGERGMKEHSGYVNSTLEEWRKTIDFAKENRKNPTEAEAVMWATLRNRKIMDFKFRRQHPIAGYIPDFVCLEKKLIIEIDGECHSDELQKKFDAGREEWLLQSGFSMLRFINDDVLNHIDNVIKRIAHALLEENGMDVTDVNSPLPWRGVGGEVKRETSTMPGFAGSSWYFLRYMDPHNDKSFCDRKISDYWNQVDLYIGGTEHAVGHLLYSRMWTKVLYDLGWIGFDEPFKKLLNQGMITGSSRFIYYFELKGVFKETGRDFISKGMMISFDLVSDFVDGKDTPVDFYERLISQSDYLRQKSSEISFGGTNINKRRVDVNLVDGVELNIEKFIKQRPEFSEIEFVRNQNGKFICESEVEKMSKSKYNTVNPDGLCDKYGADTFRMYEMFLGPVEASKPWDTKGIEGVHRFLRKLWRLFFDDMNGKVWNEEKASNDELKVLHRAIKKIEEDTERFSFNTAVSTFMICVNELTEQNCHKKEVLEKLLVLLTPYAPHISEELWHHIGNAGSVLEAVYPVYDPGLLLESTKEYPISINGKLRTTITLSLDLDQKQVEEAVLQNGVVQKWLEGKAPRKIIYVKNKMINLVM